VHTSSATPSSAEFATEIKGRSAVAELVCTISRLDFTRLALLPEPVDKAAYWKIR